MLAKYSVPTILCVTLLSVSLFAKDVVKEKSAPPKKNANGKETASKTKRYTTKKDHNPNGIGKFYMGREIAHVMGFGYQARGAKWLEREAREKEENISLLTKSLKIKRDDVIADIGAGSGVISMLLAGHLGEKGKVIAVDVQQKMLDRLKDNLKKNNITNVVPHLGKSKSPKLKKNSIDLIVMVDVYHEFEHPYEMLLALSESLKKGGRIAFVEYRMEDAKVPIKKIHKMSEAQVKKEALQAAFQLKFIETIDILPRQHIVVFQKIDKK